ncbi:MAG: VOC family protein [Candidatus Eremiobacteraeota bacterium]|nr:VOC family protein [Candidatus Eremiobacteraeota bacterium]
MATYLQPYLFFYGRCAEALAFYKSVFGGDYDVMRVGDSPVKGQMPPGSDDLVMHASFSSDAVRFLASDGREKKTVDPDAGNISLALAFDEADVAERIFAALSDGGNVQMPISEAFWGGKFGSVVDKFGTEWLATLP